MASHCCLRLLPLQAGAKCGVASPGDWSSPAYQLAALTRVAAQLAAHEADMRAADQTTKCAVLECVPSSLLTQLSRIQDCFVLSDPNQPDCPIQYASQTFLKMCGYSCR